MLDQSVNYEFKKALFDNGDPEDFICFQQNYKMTLEESGTLTPSEKFNIYALSYGKLLR